MEFKNEYLELMKKYKEQYEILKEFSNKKKELETKIYKKLQEQNLQELNYDDTYLFSLKLNIKNNKPKTENGTKPYIKSIEDKKLNKKQKQNKNEIPKGLIV